MLERLQKKWNVTPGRLLLILVTFAVGGSLTGYAGRKLLPLFGIGNAVLQVVVYIVVMTFIWPFAVLAVSVFTGQASFFVRYLSAMGRRIARRGRAEKVAAPNTQEHIAGRPQPTDGSQRSRPDDRQVSTSRNPSTED